MTPRGLAPGLVGVMLLALIFSSLLEKIPVALARTAPVKPPDSYQTGSAASGSPVPQATSASAGTAAPVPTQATIFPVQTVTPDEDGNLIHIVQPGEALWNIAMAYRISLAELMALNGYTDKTVIYPGEKVLVRRAVATATPTEPPSATPTASATPRPTRTLRSTSTQALNAAHRASPTVASVLAQEFASQGMGNDTLLVVILLLLVSGFGLLGMGWALKHRLPGS